MRDVREIIRSELTPFNRYKTGWSQLLAWVYPNGYEVGMSNIGYQWLFEILNDHQHLLVERFFHLNRGEPKSIEGGRPLREFPIIALSMPYEMDIFNFLNMLSESGIPLRSCDRENGQIVVVGGDAVTLNPFPFAEFFDIIVLGCGEAWARQFPEILREMPAGLSSKESILDEAAKIPGVWIPARDNGGEIQRSPNTRVTPAYTPILTSFGHFRNMFLVEIQRGCAFRCAFCASSWLGTPFFNYDTDSILETYNNYGQSAGRVGLVGSAVSEHPQFEKIVRGFGDSGIGVSPSSLRFDRISEATIASIAQTGIRKLTFAPETASENLARRIGKWIPPKDIIDYVSNADKLGFREVKLYWIVGLPGESADDIECDARAIADIASATDMKIGCSINPFIPKPHTVFQREAMPSHSDLSRTISILKKSIGKRRNLRIDFNYSRRTRISALLSIGGREISPVLLDIANGQGIKKAFRDHGIDIDDKIVAPISPEWERII